MEKHYQNFRVKSEHMESCIVWLSEMQKHILLSFLWTSFARVRMLQDV